MFSIRTGLVSFSSLAAMSAIACIFMNPTLAQSLAIRGWELEWGVKTPSYAVIDPESTNLNIDSVALVCGEGSSRTGLQMQLYLSSAGPLTSYGARWLKDEPRAEIVIDGASFPVDLFFADDFVVLADEDPVDEDVPLISDAVIDAMQAGRIMVLRFDLLPEGRGEPAVFDGSAVFDLQAGMGGGALAAVRRCAGQPGARSAAIATGATEQ